MKLRVQTVTALVVGVSMAALPLTADAGWGSLGGSWGGSSGGSGGYSAAYASGGSSGYYAANASHGNSGGYASHGASAGRTPGLLHRIADRIRDHVHAKRARRSARYASYGSAGGYGSSGGYSASYSSYGSGGGSSGYSNYGSSGAAVSYGSTGSSYGSAGSVHYGASRAASSSFANSLVSNQEVEKDAVYLTVAVPGSAKVFVNGNETTSTGSVRQFVSRGLEEGKSYKFNVRAEVPSAEGDNVTETKELVLRGGDRRDLEFAFDESEAPIQTAVTLDVPEDASVTLAGNPTQAIGKQRVFRTNSLKPGEMWDDYEIEVKVGDQVKRQTVRLVAGDNLEMTFQFDENDGTLVASR